MVKKVGGYLNSMPQTFSLDHISMKFCLISAIVASSIYVDNNIHVAVVILTHLSRMDFPTIINWTSPFPFEGLVGCIF